MAKSLSMINGQKIPSVGYGTWQSTNAEELENALNAALETGYRHIDTAYVYTNEHIVGKVVNEWISSGKLKREDIFITTKLPMPGLHENRVEMFMKKSLDNLKLDYVDLYLIHFPVGTNYVEGYVRPPPDKLKLEQSSHYAVWKKMEEQVDAGRTRSIGLSNFNRNQVERVIKSARIKPACLQVELHVMLQQRELVTFCHNNDMVVVAYCSLGSPGYNKFLNNMGFESKTLPNMLENPVVKQIADKYRKTSGQILLRFLLQNRIIPIPKSITPSRIKQNFEIYDFDLDSEDIKSLQGLDLGEKGRICDFDMIPLLKTHPEFPFPG